MFRQAPLFVPAKIMRITILYDNYTLLEKARFDWGFSCLVQSEKSILFDTGSSGEDLLFNMELLRIDPGCIDFIVVSHDHWDHTGGLSAIFRANSGAELVVGKQIFGGLSPEIKNAGRQRLTAGIAEICKGVFTTGELRGSHNGHNIFEQSLILNTSKGRVVVAGCSHSGVNEILKTASETGPVSGLIGGLHGFDEYDLLANLDLIVPTHCTVHRDNIKKAYPVATQFAGIGWSMTF